jgi:hypothetical protein
MGQWTAQTEITAVPAEVLELLTEPDAISRWAPIDFELVDWDGDRLLTGEHVRVHGHLAGRSLEFEVHIAEADDGNLVLSASGPIQLDVEYHARPSGAGSELCASVNVTGRGFVGRLLAQATDSLLAGGALRTAVDRLARELELEPALVA